MAADRHTRRGGKGPHRENVPGELDHASGELEELATREVGDLDDDGDVDERDRALARTGGRRTEVQPKGSGGPRFLQFLKASWAELQRVQWPDRRQVGQAIAVVIGFVIVAG